MFLKSSTGNLEIRYLDAGQGDCTLILFPDGKTTWMIDCGCIKNGSIVAGEIKKAIDIALTGRGGINTLILTHPDQDHYNLLGTLDLFNTYHVGEVIFGGHIESYQNGNDNNYTYNHLTSYFTGGKSYDLPYPTCNWVKYHDPSTQVTATILAANLDPTHRIPNDQSVAVLVQYKNYKFFLMGDATFKTENFITTYCPQAAPQANEYTILKLGHHGSQVTSSSHNWIKFVKPAAIIASSDTMEFHVRAMPEETLIDNIISWTSLRQLSYSHNYVVFCDKSTDPYYKKPKLKPTQVAICTTLYQLTYNPAKTRYVSEGGSWWYRVDSNGTLYITPSWQSATQLTLVHEEDFAHAK